MTGAPDGKTVKPEEPGNGGSLLIISDDYNVQIKKGVSKIITIKLVLVSIWIGSCSKTVSHKSRAHASRNARVSSAFLNGVKREHQESAAKRYELSLDFNVLKSLTGRCTTPDDILGLEGIARTDGLNRLAFGNNDSRIRTDTSGHWSLSATRGAVLGAASVIGVIALTVATRPSVAAGTRSVDET
ncbi:virulence plasmid b [Fusarium tjaetaba]|uniref:Virulence plasmid b n=1 Tax=Fusarium tjaetaba TaxID=1567544 RepID=A0A8H5RF35_9HYPO|nr:virulence plasmid b [Fusarium tjaetaba]KAF5631372.1 virulence plasmid b [Fusarium tjaetaba]